MAPRAAAESAAPEAARRVSAAPPAGARPELALRPCSTFVRAPARSFSEADYTFSAQRLVVRPEVARLSPEREAYVTDVHAAAEHSEAAAKRERDWVHRSAWENHPHEQ
jgi:hypothetical protein